MSMCHVPAGEAATRDAPGYPCEYPCVLGNARDAAREALTELYAGPLSRPEYWAGRLGFLLEYLLAATEPDVPCGGRDDSRKVKWVHAGKEENFPA